MGDAPEQRKFKYWDENTSPETVGNENDLTEVRKSLFLSRSVSALLESYDVYPGGRVKFKCIRGPIGDGKSVGCCVYIVKKSQEQITIEVTEKGRTFKVKWSRWLIMRHTLKSIKETTLTTWNQLFGDKTRWKTEPFEGRYEDYMEDGTLLRIDFIVLASEANNILSDLQSLELSGAWINEAIYTPYEVVAKVFTRLKRFNPTPLAGIELKTFHVVMDTNSPSEFNWWYQKEQKEQPDGWLFIICPPAVLEEVDPVTKQVRYVPNDIEYAAKHKRRPAENVKEIDGGYHRGMTYWTDMLSVLPPDEIRKLLMNQFGLSVDGLGVFREVWNPAVHRIPSETVRFMRGLHVVGGMDMGRTPAAVLAQFYNGHLVAQTEVTTWNDKLNDNRGGLEHMDVGQFYDEYLLPELVNRYGYPNCSLQMFGDPAGANCGEVVSFSAIKRLQDEKGLNIVPCDEVQAAAQGVIDITHGNSTDIRISCVKKEMRAGNLLISDACRLLCEAMAGKYFWETMRSLAKNGTIRYKDEPCKNDWSHICDAYQYLVLAVFRGAVDYSKPLAAAFGGGGQYQSLVGMASSAGCSM